MSEIHIFAVIHTKPEGLERVKELLSNLCKSVHGKEDYTNRYLATERIDGGGADICIFETYKDMDSAEKHTTEQHFKDFFAAVQSEGLSAGQPYIAKTKAFAGFDSDRKLVN